MIGGSSPHPSHHPRVRHPFDALSTPAIRWLPPGPYCTIGQQSRRLAAPPGGSANGGMNRGQEPWKQWRENTDIKKGVSSIIMLTMKNSYCIFWFTTFSDRHIADIPSPSFLFESNEVFPPNSSLKLFRSPVSLVESNLPVESVQSPFMFLQISPCFGCLNHVSSP